MDIIQKIKQDYPVGTQFRDLVHNEIFTVKNHIIYKPQSGIITQVYIPVEPNPKGNETARIYKDGKFAEKIEKPKLEVGKWYKYCGWYIKYSHHDTKGHWKASEHISTGGVYHKTLASFGIDTDNEKVLLTDLSEIQQYLPDNHKDSEKYLP